VRSRVERDLIAQQESMQNMQTLLAKLTAPAPAASADDAVDKTLITNLFVSYFNTNK
jgi:hypothetical protein